MSTDTAIARLDGDGLRFLGSTGSGHAVVMDSADGDAGPRPAELLLLAQAGCTAMDVASILRKKRQQFSRYEVRIAGDRREAPPPHVFEDIRIVHVVEGDVDPEAVRRAIELSATKYCTVTGNLASGLATIRHAYLIRSPDGDEQYRTVAVTGPRMTDPASGAAIGVGAGHEASASPRRAPGLRGELDRQPTCR